MDEEIQEETIEEELPEEEVTEEEVETPEEETPEETPIDVEAIKIEIREKAKADEEIDYGEDIDPDDVAVISKVVDAQTSGVKKILQEAQDRAEIEEFIREKPEFAKYKPALEKYIKHPVYSQIPVKNIAVMVASDELMRLGAVKEREAQVKADSTKTGGNPVRRPQGGQTDWTRASKDEFESQKRKVLGQQV